MLGLSNFLMNCGRIGSQFEIISFDFEASWFLIFIYVRIWNLKNINNFICRSFAKDIITTNNFFCCVHFCWMKGQYVCSLYPYTEYYFIREISTTFIVQVIYLINKRWIKIMNDTDLLYIDVRNKLIKINIICWIIRKSWNSIN